MVDDDAVLHELLRAVGTAVEIVPLCFCVGPTAGSARPQTRPALSER